MADLAITAADVVVLLVVVLSGLLAFARGFVHEVLAVGGWVGAILATIYGLPYVRPFAQQMIGTDPVPVIGRFIGREDLANIAAGLAIFFITLIVLSLFTSALSRRVKDSALSALDRSLGFAFGVLRGAVLISVIYIGVEAIWAPAQQPTWLRNARSMPLVETGAALLKSLVSAEEVEKGAAAAQDAVQGARKALETEQMLRDMISPTPKSAPAGGERSSDGYGIKERRDMERLLDSSGGRDR